MANFSVLSSPHIMSDIEDLAFLANTLTSTFRYSEAIATIKTLIQKNPTLDENQRRLFESVFKKAIDPHRETLRRLIEFYNSEADYSHIERAEILQRYKDKAYAELNGLCENAISLIKSVLLPHAADNVAKVFYYKGIADYYRYIAEFRSDENDKRSITEAEANYKRAVELSNNELLKSDPLRLGVILNYGIFLFDHMKRSSEAIEMLQTARKDAELDMPQLQPEQRTQALTVLEAMRINMTDWCDFYGK